MAFRVGQKVVYARKIWGAGWFYRLIHPAPGDKIFRGQIYEVSAVLDDGDCIALRGIHSPANLWWSEGFIAACFDPLVERKTDISFAHEILRKASKKQGADA